MGSPEGVTLHLEIVGCLFLFHGSGKKKICVIGQTLTFSSSQGQWFAIVWVPSPEEVFKNCEFGGRIYFCVFLYASCTEHFAYDMENAFK